MQERLLMDHTVSWPSVVQQATYRPQGDALTMDTSCSNRTQQNNFCTMSPANKNTRHNYWEPCWQKQNNSFLHKRHNRTEICNTSSAMLWQQMCEKLVSTLLNQLWVNPFSPTFFRIVTKISLPKRSEPYWSNPSFLIFWHSDTLVLRTERQSVRMSKN